MKKHKYKVTVTVEQLVPDRELHQEDREDNPRGLWHYTIYAGDAENAEQFALDMFHDNVPVHTLDDYRIYAEVTE